MNCGGCFAAFFGQDIPKALPDDKKPGGSPSSKGGGQGSVRDHYITENKALGAGSYGTVCKAKHKKTGSVRALKTICKTAGGSSSKVLERFYCEIDIMKRLDHPGIIKLYETFEVVDVVSPREVVLLLQSRQDAPPCGVWLGV